VPELLAGTSLFAHTSGAEGFPNTLLEAWAMGVPSVSVVDPDLAVSTFGAGARVDDEDEFVEAIRGLMYDPDRRRALGMAARAYVQEHHAPDSVARSFERALGLEPPGAKAVRAIGAA
jgi:glycosyltransferase involved in cell wall biosynthesis